jgi:hypothetical protein
MFRELHHALSLANIEPTSYTPISEKFSDITIPYNTFLMGGIAGAISRTATAPIDRLKVSLKSGPI